MTIHELDCIENARREGFKNGIIEGLNRALDLIDLSYERNKVIPRDLFAYHIQKLIDQYQEKK